MKRVAVVGGGIAGLSSALTVLGLGAEVAVFEATPRLGGKLRTSPFAGIPALDEGADAFLARLPWGIALAGDVGLGDQLVSPTGVPAMIWWDRLHPIPAGLMLGVPTGLRSLVTSRLLTWRGKVRAAIEPLLPRTDISADALGRWVRSRFGDEVHERLVDPLIGSIYAADTDHFSLAAVPQLAALAQRRSALLGRRPPVAGGPVFYAPRQGMGELAAAAARSVADHGGELRPDAAVNVIEPAGAGWRVDDEPFDAVVVACPAPSAAALLSPVHADVGEALGGIEGADVAVVTAAVPAAEWPESLRGRSGYLVARQHQRLVTAVSFGSQKWAHWDNGSDVILRISLGRDGLPVGHLTDDLIVAAAIGEMSRHLGIDLAPTATRLTRWPWAFPQHRPHHRDRVASAERALHPTIALAGASYHGIGVPMCIRSGQDAAQRVVAACAEGG